jgi:hypothetical protein
MEAQNRHRARSRRTPSQPSMAAPPGIEAPKTFPGPQRPHH